MSKKIARSASALATLLCILLNRIAPATIFTRSPALLPRPSLWKFAVTHSRCRFESYAQGSQNHRVQPNDDRPPGDARQNKISQNCSRARCPQMALLSVSSRTLRRRTLRRRTLRRRNLRRRTDPSSVNGVCLASSPLGAKNSTNTRETKGDIKLPTTGAPGQ